MLLLRTVDFRIAVSTTPAARQSSQRGAVREVTFGRRDKAREKTHVRFCAGGAERSVFEMLADQSSTLSSRSYGSINLLPKRLPPTASEAIRRSQAYWKTRTLLTYGSNRHRSWGFRKLDGAVPGSGRTPGHAVRSR